MPSPGKAAAARIRRPGLAERLVCVVRFAALREIGLLDDRFFIFFEDTDLGARLLDAGWSSAVSPNSRMLHHGHQVVSQPSYGSRMERQMIRSRYLYFRKHDRASVPKCSGLRRARRSLSAQRRPPSSVGFAGMTMSGRSPSCSGASPRTTRERLSSTRSWRAHRHPVHCRGRPTVVIRPTDSVRTRCDPLGASRPEDPHDGFHEGVHRPLRADAPSAFCLPAQLCEPPAPEPHEASPESRRDRGAETNAPETPSSMISNGPPIGYATTGRPAAIASSRTSPNGSPSARVDRHIHQRVVRGGIRDLSGEDDVPGDAEDGLRARGVRSAYSTDSPRRIPRRSGLSPEPRRERRSATAWMTLCCPFQGCSRPTIPTTQAFSSMPSSSLSIRRSIPSAPHRGWTMNV